jgi:NADH:ubiquinone oxidoreductase subunit 6 (subunit J)
MDVIKIIELILVTVFSVAVVGLALVVVMGDDIRTRKW